MGRCQEAERHLSSHLSVADMLSKAIPVSRNTSYRKWNLLERFGASNLLVSQAKTLARHDLNVCAPLKLQPPNS